MDNLGHHGMSRNPANQGYFSNYGLSFEDDAKKKQLAGVQTILPSRDQISTHQGWRMELVFLDESGSPITDYAVFTRRYETDFKNALAGRGPFPPYPFFVLAALSLPERMYGVVQDRLDDLKHAGLGSSPRATTPEYELKGSILYALRTGATPTDWSKKRKRRPHLDKQQAVWERLSPDQLVSLEDGVFELLKRSNSTIWAVVLRQADLYRRHKEYTWNPLDWALTYMQQRIAQQVQFRHGTYSRAILVADEMSTLSSAVQFDRFLQTRDRINATTSWPANFSDHLIDIPVMAKSHLVAPLQLVDVVAHAVMRRMRHNDPLGWFARIHPLVARHWSTGQIDNAGLTTIK